ncbi:hypothetical protein ACSYDW_10355 [Paeniglutamicibacter sp. R2-26]|uniref:hypothetical protein n=1 Tax=Paeniglutamicibacter sp. R2-26 TaxID=3144417 RepID=UPI003EE63E29
MRYLKASGFVIAATLLLAPFSIGAANPAMAADQPHPIDIHVKIPETAENPKKFTVTDAQFRWGLNKEASSGAHFGGCNFLSAGVAGNTGSSRPWTESDGFYTASSGETRIEKPGSSGTWVMDSWDKKCLDASGREVGTSAGEQGTGSQVVIDGGTGDIDMVRNTAEIHWKGSFSVAMYGGLTYWSATDPVLSVANGKGTLSATLSGYGSDRLDTTKWSKLAPRQITLATLPSVELGEKGIVAEPAYKQVRIDGVEIPQARDGANWGSFPADFVGFQAETGQGAYWYSSGGAGDGRKVASPIYAAYTPDASIAPTIPPATKPQVPGGTDAGMGDQSGTGSESGNNSSSGDGSVVGGGSGQGTVVGSGTVVETPPAGTVLAAAATAAVGAANWLGGSFIPGAIELAKDHREMLLWSIAGLLILTALSWVGFRRGWFVLPFSTPKSDS